MSEATRRLAGQLRALLEHEDQQRRAGKTVVPVITIASALASVLEQLEADPDPAPLLLLLELKKARGRPDSVTTDEKVAALIKVQELRASGASYEDAAAEVQRDQKTLHAWENDPEVSTALFARLIADRLAQRDNKAG